MFYGHRVDTQEVDTCRGPHSPRLRWPSPLVTVGTGYGAISPLQPTSIPSTWDPAPVPPGSCLGPREQRREGGAMETPGGTAPPHPVSPGTLSPGPFVLPRPAFSRFFCTALILPRAFANAAPLA